jgi:hypothetical protein
LAHLHDEAVAGLRGQLRPDHLGGDPLLAVFGVHQLELRKLQKMQKKYYLLFGTTFFVVFQNAAMLKYKFN